MIGLSYKDGRLFVDTEPLLVDVCMARRNWAQQMRHLNVRRIPPAPANPRTGDVGPVFAIYAQGFEEAHVYFYHDGGWRFLFNPYAVRSWSQRAEQRVQAKLSLLQDK